MGSRSIVDLASAAGQFAQWRARRPRGARIPETLWEVAVTLARTHGVSRAAIALSLDYYALKGRLDRSGAKEGETRGAAAVRFVEFPLTASRTESGCVVEYTDGQGRQLRVELHGGATAKLEALARALLGRGRL